MPDRGVDQTMFSSAWTFSRRLASLPLPLIILLLGIVTLTVPTLVSLARDYWSTDNGVHGPILLFAGVWLLWRERGFIRMRARPLPSLWLAVLVPPLLLLYVYGRALGVLTVECAALYALLVGLACFYWDRAVIRRLWFPIVFLGFLVRPPSGFVAEVTQPLKIWISMAATNLLHWAGYAIASSGVRIQVDQYELLVQQACAGLGSIFSLLAIGLLYLHLAPSSVGQRRLWLVASIIPIAIGANLLRVIVLILLTVHFGEGVAQGFAHQLAGITTFMVSLLLLIGLDHALALIPSRTPVSIGG